MLFSNRVANEGGKKINSVIFKEKQVWQEEEKEMSNTSVSAFQMGLFESSVVPKVLTHPWHFSTSTFTLKQSKLLNGGVKEGYTGEQWGVHAVCTWECSLRSHVENLIVLQVKLRKEKRKFAFNSQPGKLNSKYENQNGFTLSCTWFLVPRCLGDRLPQEELASPAQLLGVYYSSGLVSLKIIRLFL